MYTELIQKAFDAREKAYAPYSRFTVGVALLTENGRIFCGINIENASYGATVCAERVAIYKAVSEGEIALKSIAIVGGRGDQTEFCSPCGICRQVMAEFAGDDFEIILATSEDEYKIFTLGELFPEAFSRENL
jgi:cytidine deaminase, homotetrameric